MYLVTGATGFLGAHLVCHLLQAGYRVRAMKRSSSRPDEFDYISSIVLGKEKVDYLKNLEWVIADLNHQAEMEDALEGIEKVFHCAAVVSFHAKDHAFLYQVNAEGTAQLVNLCLGKGVLDFFHISSTAAIGSTIDGSPADEETEWKRTKKTSIYSLSKYAAEMEVWRGAEEGLNICIVNPSIIIGPGIWKRGTCRLFYNIMKGFPFYSTGSNAFVDVKDVCKAILFLHKKRIQNERFLLHGTNWGFENLFFRFAEIAGYKKPGIQVGPAMVGFAWRYFKLIEWLTGKRGVITRESAASSIKHQSFSSEKIEKLGFKFTPIEATLSEIADRLKAAYAAN
jgi:nucleoside-diphosphate-sugar epimerase